MSEQRNGHKEFSSEEISQWIARYRASGLGLEQFARKNGMRPGQLHYWIYYKQRRNTRQPVQGVASKPLFQELKLPAGSSVQSWAAEVSLPAGVAVRFNQAAAPAWIGAVVQALQKPC